MAQWEYRAFIRIATAARGDGFVYTWAHDATESRSGAQMLNDFGLEGWELVTMVSVPFGTAPGGHLHYVMKRPKE